MNYMSLNRERLILTGQHPSDFAVGHDLGSGRRDYLGSRSDLDHDDLRDRHFAHSHRHPRGPGLRRVGRIASAIPRDVCRSGSAHLAFGLIRGGSRHG